MNVTLGKSAPTMCDMGGCGLPASREYVLEFLNGHKTTRHLCSQHSNEFFQVRSFVSSVGHVTERTIG